MFGNRFRAVCTALFVLVCCAAGAHAQTIPPLVRLTADDVDVAACRAFVDGAPADSPSADDVLGALGVQNNNGWVVGSRSDGKTRQYLIVFKTPKPAGALLAPLNSDCQYLLAGESLPTEPLTAKWTSCVFPTNQSGWKVATLANGTSVNAILITLHATWGEWDRLRAVRLLGPRLYDIVPDATANADAEWINKGMLHAPVPHVASNITKGEGTWQSDGPDDKGNVARTPLSSAFPTWFVVSWNTPQPLATIRIASNFRKFTLLSYNGPDGVNPAVATDDDWTPLSSYNTDDGDATWVTFRPLTTRGIKFVCTDSTDVRFGRIDGLHVYTDLGDAPAPVRTNNEAKPPCTFTYNVPADGYVTAVIDDSQGHRIRNLVAREWRSAGPYTIGWDLNDESGQMAQPGTYHWKVLYNPGLKLKYEMTAYPNIGDNSPENSAWLNGASGPGGWLADHSAPRAVCAAGDRVFVSSPVSESGVSLIECDLTGKKDWGYGNIIAWTGPSHMASDGKALYTAPDTLGTDYVWRFSLPDKKLDTMEQIDATATRKRGIRGMAARDGKLYLAINAGTDYLENAASVADVNLDTSVPSYLVAPKTNKYDDPDPRSDFLRAFRLTGTPPGCRGLIDLVSTKDERARQHIILSFTHPVPIGSVVFPLPDDPKIEMRISVLKPDAPAVLMPRKDSVWTEIFKGNGPGWTVVAAPPGTLTRALRISFDHGEQDVENEGVDMRAEDPEAVDDPGAAGAPAWQAKLEGMKILRRRFANLFSTCQVHVNSGSVTPTGEWDANRTTPLTASTPAIYEMEWDKIQHLRGLAIKEIDGKQTEIDAWTGPDSGPVDINSDKNWTNIATYEQKLRYYYQPDQNNNAKAPYIDGYVDFGRDIATRAIRLRVVEQWMWREADRAGDVGVRVDRGGQTMDPTRCHIYGVAPLQYLGDEAPVDQLATERMEVYDTTTGKMVKEWPLPNAGPLACAPAGLLYAISDGHIVTFDPENGKITPIEVDVKKPTALAADKAGNIYVFDGAPDQRVVKVFTAAGKPVRTIGTPGGRVAGPWDPTRFTSSPNVGVDLAVDEQNQLWVAESDFQPKRVSIWGSDGTFKKDLLGNTAYGGGGCLDPNDKTRLFYGPMEFSLDWQTGLTKLKGMTWLGDSPAGEMPITIKDRQYMVTRPNFNRQPVGVVYLYEHGTLKRVAALGRAGNFPPLRTPEVLEKLGKTALGLCTFIWTDLNGDGIVQPNEVQFFSDEDGRVSPGRFENTLSIDGGGAYRYEVTGFTPDGAPLYTRVKKPATGMLVKLDTGNFFVAGQARDRIITPAGGTVSSYPAEDWGVQALDSAKPYSAAQVVAEFDVIGHETAPTGDLGEFLVTNSNTGKWHIWTADGMLAGSLFNDIRAPGTQPWSMREHDRGLDLTAATVGQEHFSGYFCKTADNHYYVVAGHNHVSVVEVQGLDKIVRSQGDLAVTVPMVQQAVTWNRAQLSRALYESAKLIVAKPNTAKLDGNADEWENLTTSLQTRDVSFGMSYDDKNLYVAYIVKDSGPIKNSGNDWKRLFKTGAACDLQIGVNPNAPVDRTSPVVGDERILMTVVDGKPIAVLYQPNAPGSKPDEAWESHTDVFTSKFDRVVQLPDVQIVTSELPFDAGYCLEASIPLKSIGLTIRDDMQIKMDWGILSSGPEGTEVLQRLYWANPLTAIVSDEAAESMLHPDLWGLVRFKGAGAVGDAPDAGPAL